MRVPRDSPNLHATPPSLPKVIASDCSARPVDLGHHCIKVLAPSGEGQAKQIVVLFSIH